MLEQGFNVFDVMAVVALKEAAGSASLHWEK